jgi:predicted RNase H-like HicB family nuclease
MIREYIDTALRLAHYEIIDDEEPFFGEVPGLQGVWATGRTLEECRRNLAEVIDGWLLVRLSRGLLIPRLGEAEIVAPGEMAVAQVVARSLLCVPRVTVVLD